MFKVVDLTTLSIQDIVKDDLKMYLNFVDRYLKRLTLAFLEYKATELGLVFSSWDGCKKGEYAQATFYRREFSDPIVVIAKDGIDAYRKAISTAIELDRLVKENQMSTVDRKA